MKDVNKELTRQALVENNWDNHIDIPKLIELVRADEREACAKLADEYATWGGSNFFAWFKKLSADIRARGQA
jgi:hypothetical protein